MSRISWSRASSRRVDRRPPRRRLVSPSRRHADRLRRAFRRQAARVACALALVVGLVGLLVATSESLRRQEGTFPFTQAVEPDLPVASIDPPSTYHDPGVGAWPQP